MYMDNHDDQQDLFRRLLSTLENSTWSVWKRNEFSTGYQVAINTAIVFLKKEKIDKYMGISTLSKRKRMIQKLRSQINIFYKLFKMKKIDKVVFFGGFLFIKWNNFFFLKVMEWNSI
jgi:hypothetical protein